MLKRIYRFLHNKRRHWLHLSYHLSKSKPQRPRQASEWDQIDVERTGIGSTSRLYLYNETNKSSPPKSTLQGYHIGAADNDQLRVRIHESDYHGDIVMPPTEKDAIKITGTKRYDVGRNVSTGNSITSNTLTLTENHSLLNGETIRVISDNVETSRWSRLWLDLLLNHIWCECRPTKNCKNL